MTTASLLGSRLPLAAAPMAGGPTTVALAAAVAGAGAFPFLAGGYKSAEALSEEIEQLHLLDAPFGVNLFVPSQQGVDTAAFRAYAAELQPEAHHYGMQLNSEPIFDDDRWSEKLALLLARPVPVVSFTFGLPAAKDIAQLRDVDSMVLATVTTADEAVAAKAAGVDGLIVQSPYAGGHSATYEPARVPAPIGTAELTRHIRDAIELPLIAAGGIDGPESVRALMNSGAQAVAVGTLLLRTDEAGTSPAHRAALTDASFAETVITRAFTGRPARALRNGFIARHGSTAPVAYPAVHHLTRELRQAAGRAGDTDRLHLWAGTGYRNAPSGSAADLIRFLASAL